MGEISGDPITSLYRSAVEPTFHSRTKRGKAFFKSKIFSTIAQYILDLHARWSSILEESQIHRINYNFLPPLSSLQISAEIRVNARAHQRNAIPFSAQ